MLKIGFIGTGNMGGALAKAAAKSGGLFVRLGLKSPINTTALMNVINDLMNVIY